MKLPYSIKTIQSSITLLLAAGMLTLVPFGVQAGAPSGKMDAKSHQEGPPPASGEIVKLTADSIEIKDHKGEMHTFMIDAKTMYGTKAKPEKHADFKVGEHVLVNYTKANGKMTADVIRELPAHQQGKTGAEK